MNYVFLVSMLGVSLNCFGQFVWTNQTNSMVNINSGGIIMSLPPAPPAKIGSYYLYNEWHRADIFLKDSTKLVEQSIKIDLKENVIDVQYKNVVKALPISMVIALVLKKGTGESEEYVNGSSFFGKGSVYSDQLLCIVFNGKASLLSRMETKVIEATDNSVPMLVSAKKESEVVFKERYLIAKGKSIVEVDGGKSRVKNELMNVFGVEAEPLVKKANLKNEYDLITLAKELTNLTSAN